MNDTMTINQKDTIFSNEKLWEVEEFEAIVEEQIDRGDKEWMGEGVRKNPRRRSVGWGQIGNLKDGKVDLTARNGL